MRRVVLDTNVIVSGLLSAEGTCARIIRLAIEEAFVVCVDDRILAEYGRVLRRPKLQIDQEEAEGLLEILREICEVITPMPMPMRLPDESDVPFLEVAAACDAVLVTGNLRHFPRERAHGARIITPTEFLDILKGDGG